MSQVARCGPVVSAEELAGSGSGYPRMQRQTRIVVVMAISTFFSFPTVPQHLSAVLS